MSNKQLLLKAEAMTDNQLMSHCRKRKDCQCMTCIHCICFMVWETRKYNRREKK